MVYFFCLKRKTEGKKKSNDLVERRGNSKCWKPPNSEFTVVSVRKCTTASPETHCCLHFLFSQQKKKTGNVKLPHCTSSQSRERRFIFFSCKPVTSLYSDKRWNSVLISSSWDIIYIHKPSEQYPNSKALCFSTL